MSDRPYILSEKKKVASSTDILCKHRLALNCHICTVITVIIASTANVATYVVTVLSSWKTANRGLLTCVPFLHKQLHHTSQHLTFWMFAGVVGVGWGLKVSELGLLPGSADCHFQGRVMEGTKRYTSQAQALTKASVTTGKQIK